MYTTYNPKRDSNNNSIPLQIGWHFSVDTSLFMHASASSSYRIFRITFQNLIRLNSVGFSVFLKNVPSTPVPGFFAPPPPFQLFFRVLWECFTYFCTRAKIKINVSRFRSSEMPLRFRNKFKIWYRKNLRAQREDIKRKLSSHFRRIAFNLSSTMLKAPLRISNLVTVMRHVLVLWRRA